MPRRQLRLVEAWAEDFEPMLYGEVYGVLREPAFFAELVDPHLVTSGRFELWLRDPFRRKTSVHCD